MSSGTAKLLWVIGVFAAATVGLLAGIWIGGEIEADVHQEILMNADLPEVCWEKLSAEAERVIREYEGDAPTP